MWVFSLPPVFREPLQGLLQGFWLGFWLGCSVVVARGALAVSRSQVHRAGVLAGTAAVSGHPTGPARAVARRGAIRVLQRLVLHLGIGVGRKGPDPLDRFCHGTSG